ncbi:hypothetical protein B4U80_03330 [Leptotrombidium deliense]|uniref:Protein kinase domain-containing protein n=1 Tax=Leptotrombidium deliense TaxID=299467 RepID=A0A443S9Z8_9ACAR|nr:hypothetical protein B4U80_03330 [Leptotrombidium deliense]
MSEMVDAATCYLKPVNDITQEDYNNFIHFLNVYPEIRSKSEIAMMITHFADSTRGFNRKLKCAFERCVAQDGKVNYNGRGYIHLSNEDNYRSFSFDLYGDDRFVKDPDLVGTNQTIAWQTAFWFWTKYVHSFAEDGLFGTTLAMTFGSDACDEPRRASKFKFLFDTYKCALEKVHSNETANPENCNVLVKIVNSTQDVSALKNEANDKSVIYIASSVSAVVPKKEFNMMLLNPYETTQKNLEEIGYKACYEFPVDRLVMKEELGSGFYGVVVKAKAIGVHAIGADISTVAVKKVKDQFDYIQRTALLAELKVFLNLGKHLNIINFLGAVTVGELMIIFEFCEYGNLRDYLLNNRGKFINQLNPETQEYDRQIKSVAKEIEMQESDDGPELKTYELICYSYQISQGMEYLTSKNILHRDLAARNVLLTTGNIVKLCDFGLAKDVYHYGDYCTTSNKQLPLKWMSVEAIRDKIFTVKNDVWSFGIVLWEIFTLGCDPYPGIQIDNEFLQKLIAGYRMERPEYCPKTISILMQHCWCLEPNNRPSFELLTATLRNILDESTKHYYLQLSDNYVNFSKICYDNLAFRDRLTIHM